MQSTRHDIGTTGTIHEVPDTDGTTRWVGAVGHPVGETPELLGQRWDAFARKLFRFGLEPAGDEPVFTTRVGGTSTDHYVLREVQSFFWCGLGGGVGVVRGLVWEGDGVTMTNQSRDVDLNGIDIDDLQSAAGAIWLETRRHGATASCECPVIEAIAVLQERGYAITKEGVTNSE